MALTPFDPNIFFRRAAADTAQANQFQSAIGQLAQNYANRDERAMNKKLRGLQLQKLEKDLNAPQMPNFEEAAQRVALARASGAEPDPKDMLTVEAGAMIYAPQPVQNPITGEFYTKETPYSLLTKGQSKPQTFGGAMQGGYEYSPELPRKGALSQIPQIDASMLEDGAMMNISGKAPMPAMGMQDTTIAQMAEPRGITAPRTGYLKSDVASAEAAAKADIEIQQKRAESQREKESDRPRAELNVIQAFEKFGDDEQYIDTAINQANKYTAGMGSYLEFIRGTGATDLKNTLSKIQADSAFDRLQEMRNASKTGGALGAVSERELTLLQSAAAPLGQEQSPEQLKDNLENYRRVRKRALRNVADAFNADYGYYPEGIKLDKVQRDTPSQYVKQDYAKKYGLELE